MASKLLLQTDRVREINYNGEGNPEYLSSYQCDFCKHHFLAEPIAINYCKACGVKFEGYEDRSM